jgi:hypothetical protein
VVILVGRETPEILCVVNLANQVVCRQRDMRHRFNALARVRFRWIPHPRESENFLIACVYVEWNLGPEYLPFVETSRNDQAPLAALPCGT